ncbi:hypothetical protein SAY86_031307 [Trapa natans]|uniref:Homeobox domain-containing protein n=1 Tax=Trapa natans TaxID=22666 RepID=A0AAN7R3F3_TRANT|nr:hypothetical protein SAY86_031307 [Trapa natans]
MAALPRGSSGLELTISVPGFISSSPSENTVYSLPVRDLDINQMPSEVGGEEWMMMNPSTEDEEDTSSINGDGAGTGNGGPPRKKLRLTKEQSRLLEESFRLNHTLNTKQKEALAVELKLRPRQVEVWFQNRRARSKLKQTEMECEYFKRWFGSLTEQNRRLQREVKQLREMKVGPPTYLSPHSSQPLPASTLTMCPCCERVSSTASTDAAAFSDSAASTPAQPSSMPPSPLRPRQPSAAC